MSHKWVIYLLSMTLLTCHVDVSCFVISFSLSNIGRGLMMEWQCQYQYKKGKDSIQYTHTVRYDRPIKFGIVKVEIWKITWSSFPPFLPPTNPPNLTQIATISKQLHTRPSRAFIFTKQFWTRPTFAENRHDGPYISRISSLFADKVLASAHAQRVRILSTH